MESKVQKQIIDYFSTFEEFHNTSKACLKICQDCAISINKLIRRCNNIKEAELPDTPLENFVDLQSRLSTSLLNLISEEIQIIKKQDLIIDPLFENLCNKCNLLIDNCKLLNFREDRKVIGGTPNQPPLKVILDFLDDTISYGNLYGELIDSYLNVLAFKGSSSASQVDTLKISIEWQKRVSHILAYTSFCSDNQI